MRTLGLVVALVACGCGGDPLTAADRPGARPKHGDGSGVPSGPDAGAAARGGSGGRGAAGRGGAGFGGGGAGFGGGSAGFGGGGAGFGGGTAGTGGGSAGSGGTDWFTSATGHRGENGLRFEYDCPPGGSTLSIWGTDVYTDDSPVCVAAVHAGVITLAAGGRVSIEIRPGQDAYDGSERNGVTSLGFSTWSGSYAISTGAIPDGGARDGSAGAGGAMDAPMRMDASVAADAAAADARPADAPGRD